MDTYYAKIIKLVRKFYGIEYHHVVQDANQAANHIYILGSSRAKLLAGVFVHDLMTSSIKEGQPVDETPPLSSYSWAVPTPSPD
jgi:hypothetical protein